MKKNEKIVIELSCNQYRDLINCVMDGMLYNQERSANTTNNLMKEKYNLTYEKYFKIYAIVKNIID